MGERYGKGKNIGPQRQIMKNQTSNGRVSRFDAIKTKDEEEIPQDLNEEKEADRIFYKEGENTHTSRKNKSKGKRHNVQVQDRIGTIEYLDPIQKTFMHNVTNERGEGNGQLIKARGKHGTKLPSQ